MEQRKDWKPNKLDLTSEDKTIHQPPEYYPQRKCLGKHFIQKIPMGSSQTTDVLRGWTTKFTNIPPCTYSLLLSTMYSFNNWMNIGDLGISHKNLYVWFLLKNWKSWPPGPTCQFPAGSSGKQLPFSPTAKPHFQWYTLQFAAIPTTPVSLLEFQAEGQCLLITMFGKQSFLL